MANANITKIGVIDAVALEKEAVSEGASQEAVMSVEVAPNISERRVVGRKEVKTANGHVIVVENL